MLLWYIVTITTTAVGLLALLINESIQHKRTIERIVALKVERRDMERQLRMSFIERNRLSRRNAELERKLSRKYPEIDPPPCEHSGVTIYPIYHN
ncbi:MAG: hypothetical protein IT328_05950 [Caldilineaceae bacterium]|nr:hypothetical protein [Caldilineaceae bacterium]